MDKKQQLFLELDEKATALSDSEDQQLKELVGELIDDLDNGRRRICLPPSAKNSQWQVEAWLKKAVLHFFRYSQMQEMQAGPMVYWDKIPLKKNYQDCGVRVVPPAVARYGSFLAKGVVLMPSYINIGAYVDEGSMVDTWATVGSCAQIGKHVHLSGGVGIGGVLEPPGAVPVVVEDGAFLGSRSIVVEGVRVEKEAVLAANVTVTSSTPIIDLRTAEKKRSKGLIPTRSVCVPGTEKKEINGHEVHLSCVYIIGERKESTDRKTSLNQVLREFAISV